MTLLSACLLAASLFAALNTGEGGVGVSIQKLVVPAAVSSESGSPVILDCDYTIGDGSQDGLVVKWFFNDSPNPVYQWIYGRKPQDLGVLKRRVSLDYKASPNPIYQHRAVKIDSPSRELTGVYRCLVSTFEDEASEQKKMVVYTPARSLDFTQERHGEEVTLKCEGVGLYPEPNITISSPERTANSSLHPGRTRSLLPTIETVSKDGLYNIEARLTFRTTDLPQSTTFDCILNIPEANYTLQKSMYYYQEETNHAERWSSSAFLHLAVMLLSFLKVWF